MAGHPHFLWSDLFRKARAGRTPLLEALKANVLFKDLSRRELRYLATLVYERVYQPDEAVFQQGDRGLGMYLVVRGRIAIRTHSAHAGHENLLTTLTEGSFFGELALVDPDNQRSAAALAVDKVTLIGFFKPDLLEILERRPAMGVKILLALSAVLGKRLLETTEKISLMSRARELAQTHENFV